MRTETIGECTLYLGDCAEIIPNVGPVDAIVMDPPYVLSDSGPGASHFGMSLNKFDSEKYKDIVSGFDMAGVLDALAEVCEPFNLFSFCSNRQVSSLMSYNEQRGRATTLCIWHKTNAAPFANGVWRGDIEYVVHAKDSGAAFIGGAVEKKKVSEHPIVQDADHPTVKPLALVSKYVGICSHEGQKILDPFMGSGTTGIACVQMGRRFVGIEKDPDHFETACRRIEAAYRQPRLFAEPVAKPVQDNLFG